MWVLALLLLRHLQGLHLRGLHLLRVLVLQGRQEHLRYHLYPVLENPSSLVLVLLMPLLQEHPLQPALLLLQVVPPLQLALLPLQPALLLLPLAPPPLLLRVSPLLLLLLLLLLLPMLLPPLLPPVLPLLQEPPAQQTLDQPL